MIVVSVSEGGGGGGALRTARGAKGAFLLVVVVVLAEEEEEGAATTRRVAAAADERRAEASRCVAAVDVCFFFFRRQQSRGRREEQLRIFLRYFTFQTVSRFDSDQLHAIKRSELGGWDERQSRRSRNFDKKGGQRRGGVKAFFSLALARSLASSRSLKGKRQKRIGKSVSFYQLLIPLSIVFSF